MKPSKKNAKAIWTIYDAWLHAYLNGDVSTYDAYLHKAYHFIGSAAQEEFLNRKDATQFFADTGDQFTGKTEIRNDSRVIEQFGELIFITHLLDGWFLNNKDWRYYARFRFTSVLKNTENGWRFIYQHFSIPDSKTEEGETIGYDKINEENKELREAIQRRTKELELKNRALEIEGALDRIRAQATAMKKSSDLLDIVVTMRNEFIKLGHEAHYFWHMMWLPESYEKAMTSGDGSKIGFVMTLPRHIHGNIPQLAKWEQSKNPTVVYAMDVNEAIDYVDKMVDLGDFRSIDPQAPSHDDIRHIGGLTFIMAKTTHGEIGYSLPGVVKNPPQQDLDILIQFAGAFDLAHQRFLDLQKAEQQAREVEIELAIEKVRSRTMAMQKSEELSEASFLLDAQVRELGINTWGCAFNIYGEEVSTEWFGNEKGELKTYTVPRTGIFKEYYDAGQKGETLLIKEFSGDECVAHYEYMSTLPGIGEILEELKKTNKGFPTYQIDHVVYFKYGYLLFITREQVPEAHDIFKRFAQVFEQTYTRFLDLQKAEAQAREAQIEAALERIRAQSMAMHNSNELKDVIRVIFDQMAQLKINAEHAGIVVDYEPKKDWHFWVADHQDIPAKITVPYLDLPWDKQFTEAKKDHREFFTTQLNFEEKNSFYRQLLPHIKNLTKEAEDFYLNCAGLAASTVIQKDVGLYIENFDGTPYSDEENDILLRFAKVVQQTYTRFLDLQKAEAQAREAQIIASIERVRASTMAMHHSDELSTVLSTLFEQFDILGIKPSHAVLTLINQEKNTLNFQMTGKYGHRVVAEKEVDLDIMDAWVDTKQKWKNSKPNAVNVNEYPPETLPDMWELFAEIQAAIPKRAQPKIEDFPNGLYITEGYCKFGYIGFAHHRKPTEEEKDIVRRFAAEFGALYQRFLDLQKSEAQAREAQIEVALERVRSQSMSMQHSEELSATTQVFHQQLQLLGIDSEFSYLWLPDEEEKTHLFWATWSEDIKQKIQYKTKKVSYPLDKTEPSIAACYTAWESGEIVHVNPVKPEEVEDYFNTWEELLGGIDKFQPNLFPDGLFYIDAYMDYGCFGIMIKRRLIDNETSILKRFSKEFQSTYTRFLDLQKAEAQARESQIQLSLERVRAKAMAMQSTDELHDVLSILFQQFDVLGIKPTNVFLSLFDKEKRTLEYRASGKSGKRISRKQVVSMDSLEVWSALFDKWQNGKSESVELIYYSVEEIPVVFDLLSEVFSAMPSEERLRVEDFPNGGYSLHGHMPFGYLGYNHDRKPTQEEEEILARFAKEFSLVYQRFLDIKKAEQQAREADISIALERVRGRAMAMHHPSELHEVLSLMFNQLEGLGVHTLWTHLTLIDLDKNIFVYRMTTKDGEPVNAQQIVNLDAMEVWSGTVETFKSENPNTITRLHFTPDMLPRLWELFDDVFSSLPEDKKIDMKDFPNGIFTTQSNCKFGYLGINQRRKATPEEEKILGQFGSEFGRLYQRFLDLQKAEAQAREAQIETALEKVRSRTMAMQESEELEEVAVLLYKELIGLNVTNFVSCGYVEINEETERQLTWITDPGGDSMALFYLPLKGDKTFNERYKAWKNQQKIFHQTVSGQERINHLEYAITTFQSKAAEEMVRSQFPDPTVFYCFNFSHGYLHLVGGSLLEKKEEILLARFTRVFEQTYARFLDLKKAEIQSRQAQINLAVERVRASALAMHKSEEILDVVAKLKEEVMGLDISGVVAATIFLEAEDNQIRMWDLSSLERTDRGYLAITDITFHLKKEDPHLYIKRVWESKANYFVDVQNKKDLDRIIEFMYENNQFEVAKEVEEYTKQTNLQTLYHATIKLDKGKLSIDLLEPPSDEMEPILVKMGAAFDLAYKRFEDIKRAEAQAREAQIEAALEKVRSRTMAMQKSEELPLAANNLFLQVQELGIPAWSAGYCIWQDDKQSANCNMSSEGEIQKGFILPSIGEGYDFYTPQERGENFYVKELGGKGLVQHYEFMKKLPQVGAILKELTDAGLELPKFQIFHICYFKYGYVMFITYESVPEFHTVFKRFGKVFEQTYTRFLDLKKAEAQAREAHIEAALERVRSRSMGMQSTSDFGEVTTEMFNQLRSFGEELFATGIVFCDKHKDHVEQWHSIPGGGMLSPMIVPIDLDYIHQYRYDQWKAGKELFSIEIPSDFIEQHFEDIFKLPSAQITLKDLEERNAPMPAPPPWEIDYGASFKQGYILISSLKHLNNTDILPRFAKVFEQAYTRFLDLEIAEKNAYKSKVEAALERVRARAMAMQEPDELRDVASVLRTEMGYLGIEELETCSIYILDSKEGEAECWYAIKDDKAKGNKLISDHIAMDFNKTKVGQKMLRFHKTKKEKTSIRMKGKERIEWIRYCEQQSTLLQGFYGQEIPERTYHLHKFSNGAIGAASAGEISEESWGLLKRCASVFSLAYSRFKDLTQAKIDLKRLKAEKKRAEEALSELQTTQKQLIQSEKMASLGELTAGIAHEIQNPLNFVNNFSEVSSELLEEMKEEIENGDFEEAKAIITDVIHNLEKIHHHGQRADGIVKGMLQHSRARGDKKELTDLNALADEYLRLAYHGLRAKDKSFNAELVTDFDVSLPYVNVVPQDIGRVILNLLTNAFYVVHKKRQNEGKGYKPAVNISTKQTKDTIEIKVTDNGSGMPESVKEKIFQPFFTTKPTGDGTGLGLSLSYDIITKGHGGNITVDTQPGEGSTFIISIPH